MNNWQSPDGVNNALVLRAHYAAGFGAIAEYDRIGHLLLHRAGLGEPASTVEAIVGLAMLRRAVTLFTGIRMLLEHSLPDVAKAPARAYFELWLQHQCLAYGSTQPVTLETPTTSSAREPRARLYHVAAERWGLKARATVLLGIEGDEPGGEHGRTALERETAGIIGQLRKDFRAEWDYFGDVTDASLLITRKEPEWFAAEFTTSKVSSMRQLATASGHGREYDMLYDAFSALMHSRGTGHDVTIENKTVTVHHPHDPEWFQTIAWLPWDGISSYS